MNAKTVGGSVWLLLFGTASVFLIAAFAPRFDPGGQPEGTAPGAPAPAPTVAGADTSGPAPSPAVASAGMPMLPLDLSPGLAEIIKLAQAHIGDDTILAYVQNSGQKYNPSADEILYLSDLGVSDKVVAALVNKPDAAPAAAPAPLAASATALTPEPPAAPVPGNAGMAVATEGMLDPAAPPPDSTGYEMPVAEAEEPPPLQNPQESYFYDSLAPYGNWAQTAYGWGWQPMAAAVDPGWRPYCDRGQWMLTDDGWYWASDYSWGWAPFHYGRWLLDGRFGWVWVPGNEWAPAWVAWRNTTDGFAGWAALPPGVHYRRGAGLFAVGGRGLNVSFGLNAAAFTFVGQEHFASRNVGRYAAPVPRAAALFAASTPVNNYSFAGGRIVNAGVSAGQIAAATKAPVPKFAMKEVVSPEAAGTRLAGQSLAVFRPNVAAPVVQPKVAATVVRSSVEAASRSVLISKTPRPAATEAVAARTVAPGPATVAAATRTVAPRPATVAAATRAVAPGPATAAPDYSVQAPRPSYTASPPRPGLSGGSFQTSPSARTTPASVSPSAPAGGWTPFINEGDTRRTLSPSAPAPAVGYPSFSPRGFNPAPPVSTGTGPSYIAPQHNAPAGGAPAAVPVDSHGGGSSIGVQGGRGGVSPPSPPPSSPSPSPSKPSR